MADVAAQEGSSTFRGSGLFVGRSLVRKVLGVVDIVF